MYDFIYHIMTLYMKHEFSDNQFSLALGSDFVLAYICLHFGKLACLKVTQISY